MKVADGETTGPSFRTLDLLVHDLGLNYAFMYNYLRFHITISAENLRGEGSLLDEFNNFKDDLDNPDRYLQFEKWVLEPLNYVLERVAATSAIRHRKPITLLEYFSPPTFAFTLVNKEGNLYALQESYDPQIHGDSSPRTPVVISLPNSQLEPSFATASSLRPLPLIPASELELVESGPRDYEMSHVPKTVRRLRSNDVLFFKPGFRDHGHLREIQLLYQIGSSGKFDAPFRTSKLVGLVVWDGDITSLMGLLLEHIDGETLQSRIDDASIAMRTKWLGQVEATMRRLHEGGIVWGDVKPDNVMINGEGDAVVVDFGGGDSPQYIPMELQQTAQGDLMALDHMRAAISARHENE